MTDATSGRLVTSRLIRAEPGRLFEAWTSPEQLRQWWGPPGGCCTRAIVDPVVGGRYQLDNELADGSAVVISGRFTLVDPPRRLAYTWRVEPGPDHHELVTVTFAARGAETEVTVEHVQISGAAARDEHAAGWAACLDRLAARIGSAAMS